MRHRPDTANDAGLFLLRLAFGGYFLAAGVYKGLGEINNGFGSFYNGPFKGLQPSWLPDLLAAPYGYALPWLEILFGLLLVLGFYGTVAAAVVALMVLSFTIAKAMVFGWTAQEPDAGGPFSTNYLLIVGYAVSALMGPGRWSLDAVRGGKV